MTRRRSPQRSLSERQVVLNLVVPLASDGLIEDEQFEHSLLTLLRYAACTPSRRLFESFNAAVTVAQMERMGMEMVRG